MNAASETTRAHLVPFALKEAPALIETVFPAQKISFEAQKERKANLGQTLTGLGSYWKGRKPLILVRAIVLGSLLPQTGNAEVDLNIFEMLLGLDEMGLARRAMANDGLKPTEIAARVTLNEPWRYFSHNVKPSAAEFVEIASSTFPMDSDQRGISLRWKRGIKDEEKVELYRQALATFGNYEERAALCKRPEEVDQDWLYEPIWAYINLAYAHLGIEARSISMLVDQLGILRYGRRPRVGDTFCGGGSIPFEAARVGCEVYAADLNPIACMLTWGALNIVGASPERRTQIETAQRDVVEAVDREIAALGIDHDDEGNRAKSYLYCVEARCPETGWMVPMSPSWVISKPRRVVALLSPDPAKKRFNIKVQTDASDEQMRTAEFGTVREGALVYELGGRIYRTPIRTLRGDYRNAEGNTENRLRRWDERDFKPSSDDLFQERLYAVHWITRASLANTRQETFFASASESDVSRERLVEEIVDRELGSWQERGLVPDMMIESGQKTDEPIRTRGWTYWHHLFNARQLLYLKILHAHVASSSEPASMTLFFSKVLDWSNKCCHWHTGWEKPENLFYNQAFDAFWNYGVRSSYFLLSQFGIDSARYCDLSRLPRDVSTAEAKSPRECELFITDPPYADAVVYHEITEFFIAWLRKAPPPPFDDWVWDSRRALAIKGSGDDFRTAMVAAYREMARRMPDQGMQCVMFTHQDTSVWADMVGIFWAAGLQVVAVWYIATETTSELKKGGYVQGTVTLMLKKRPLGERAGFRQRILPAVRAEVERQIQSMMHLNIEVGLKHGEPVFNDSDLQMGGYAAALKVLTAYTHIGGEDVTTFALRPRQRGEVTVVDEIVQQAAEAANSLMVPENLNAETWGKLSGIQRFYLRMMDMETTGASKLDNYQNFAKAFRVQDYSRVMGDITANKARLKRVTEFASRDLADSTELGGTALGNLIIALQQLLKEVEPQTVVSQLQAEMPDFIEMRPLMIDMLSFIERKSLEQGVRGAAEVFGARLRNLRAIGQ